MECTKENLDTVYMNIENFSKIIGEKWNISSDVLRNYLFANISIALVMNAEMIKDINKLYALDKLKYYNTAKNSTCIEHVIIKQSTLEQEIHARKVLGILLVAELDSNLRSSVIKLLRKYYPVIYNSVKKHDKRELVKKYSQMDKMNKIVFSRLYGAIYFYLGMYRSPELVDQGFFISIIEDIKDFEFDSCITTNVDEESKAYKAEIQEIKALIKKEYGKIHSYKDILNNESKDIKEFRDTIKNLLYANKLDANYIFYDSNFLNIDEIILSYIKKCNNKSDSKMILQTLINGIFMKSLINEYKKARSLYFENNQEILLFKISSLEEKLNSVIVENKEIKSKLNLLQQEKMLFDESLNNQINKLNKSHKSEINDMQNRIKELESQLLEEKAHRSELNALREYIFEVNNEYIPNVPTKTLESYITNKKLLIIGGSKKWRRKFREKYPELRTLNGFNENFEVSILSNAHYIFFYTGFMNHATYNRAMNFIRINQIKFGYIGKTNMELVEGEIIEELERLL